MRTYKGLIKKLKEGEWFVFGSNTQGRHGAGSALYAFHEFGANYGQPIGPQGQSYAIVTKDLRKSTHPSVDMSYIIFQIQMFYQFAVSRQRWNEVFYVAYSGTGTNLNGYSPKDMATMFSIGTIPENVIFEEEFSKLLTYEKGGINL